MANMIDPKIVELAEGYLPIFLFDPLERFFPCAAEEWLTHTTTERWNTDPTHQRGTAVMRVARSAADFTAADVRAGNDPPSGGALTLDAAAPNGIGQVFPVGAMQDLFLDCAGWDDTTSEVMTGSAAYTEGSTDYLDKLFRTLAHAMNPGIPNEAPNPPPGFTVPRLASPTVYCEVEWAGQYPRDDQKRAQQTGDPLDFPLQIGPPGAAGPVTLTALDAYVVLTYYLFYPAMQPSPVAQPNFDVSRNREGQWEAVSIYLKGREDAELRDKSGRPDILGIGVSPDLFTVPKFAVYSRAYSFGDDNSAPLAAEARPWSDPLNRPAMSVTALNSHPFAYVSAGTHKNFFEIVATSSSSGSSQPNPILNTTGGALMGAAGTAAGVCLGLSPPPLTPACIICLIIAAVVFLIGLILFLLSLFLRSDPPVTESPQSTEPGTDVARDGGPASPPPGVNVDGPPGLPPTAQVPVNLRIISRFEFDATPPVTTYPLPAPGTVELPSWWSYPGRWGVRVQNRAAGQWDSGTQRVDSFDRSRGYWNTFQLVSFLSDPARATDGVTT
jgi:hypothetical protein